MNELLSGWLIRITGAALIAAVAVTLAPEGPVKKALRLVCGTMMVIALLSGPVDFDYSAYAARLADYRSYAESLIDDTQEDGTQLVRTVIEHELESYILDKAQAYGASNVEVSVTARWSSDGYWYPDVVTIAGDFDDNARQALAQYIAAEFGIPETQQEWEWNADEKE